MSQYTVAELVPHSGVMSLLDEIIEHDDHRLAAVVTIRPGSLFCEARGVPGWVGIEYMAQAIAAYAGAQGRQAGQGVKIGFLLGARRYQCSAPYFPIGARLMVTVRQQLQSDNGLGAFECEIRAQGIEATASLNVFQPDNAQEFLQQSSAKD